MALSPGEAAEAERRRLRAARLQRLQEVRAQDRRRARGQAQQYREHRRWCEATAREVLRDQWERDRTERLVLASVDLEVAVGGVGAAHLAAGVAQAEWARAAVDKVQRNAEAEFDVQARHEAALGAEREARRAPGRGGRAAEGRRHGVRLAEMKRALGRIVAHNEALLERSARAAADRAAAERARRHRACAPRDYGATYLHDLGSLNRLIVKHPPRGPGAAESARAEREAVRGARSREALRKEADAERALERGAAAGIRVRTKATCKALQRDLGAHALRERKQKAAAIVAAANQTILPNADEDRRQELLCEIFEEHILPDLGDGKDGAGGAASSAPPADEAGADADLRWEPPEEDGAEGGGGPAPSPAGSHRGAGRGLARTLATAVGGPCTAQPPEPAARATPRAGWALRAGWAGQGSAPTAAGAEAREESRAEPAGQVAGEGAAKRVQPPGTLPPRGPPPARVRKPAAGPASGPPTGGAFQFGGPSSSEGSSGQSDDAGPGASGPQGTQRAAALSPQTAALQALDRKLVALEARSALAAFSDPSGQAGGQASAVARSGTGGSSAASAAGEARAAPSDLRSRASAARDTGVPDRLVVAAVAGRRAAPSGGRSGPGRTSIRQAQASSGQDPSAAGAGRGLPPGFGATVGAAVLGSSHLDAAPRRPPGAGPAPPAADDRPAVPGLGAAGFSVEDHRSAAFQSGGSPSSEASGDGPSVVQLGAFRFSGPSTFTVSEADSGPAGSSAPPNVGSGGRPPVRAGYGAVRSERAWGASAVDGPSSSGISSAGGSSTMEPPSSHGFDMHREYRSTHARAASTARAPAGPAGTGALGRPTGERAEPLRSPKARAPPGQHAVQTLRPPRAAGSQGGAPNTARGAEEGIAAEVPALQDLADLVTSTEGASETAELGKESFSVPVSPAGSQLGDVDVVLQDLKRQVEELDQQLQARPAPAALRALGSGLSGVSTSDAGGGGTESFAIAPVPDRAPSSSDISGISDIAPPGRVEGLTDRAPSTTDTSSKSSSGRGARTLLLSGPGSGGSNGSSGRSSSESVPSNPGPSQPSTFPTSTTGDGCGSLLGDEQQEALDRRAGGFAEPAEAPASASAVTTPEAHRAGGPEPTLQRSDVLSASAISDTPPRKGVEGTAGPDTLDSTRGSSLQDLNLSSFRTNRTELGPATALCAEASDDGPGALREDLGADQGGAAASARQAPPTQASAPAVPAGSEPGDAPGPRGQLPHGLPSCPGKESSLCLPGERAPDSAGGSDARSSSFREGGSIAPSPGGMLDPSASAHGRPVGASPDGALTNITNRRYPTLDLDLSISKSGSLFSVSPVASASGGSSPGGSMAVAKSRGHRSFSLASSLASSTDSLVLSTLSQGGASDLEHIPVSDFSFTSLLKADTETSGQVPNLTIVNSER